MQVSLISALYCKHQHNHTMYSLQSLHVIDLHVAYLAIVIGFVDLKKKVLEDKLL